MTEPEEARVCVPADGDHVATIGENRKMLIFKLDEVNEMARGKGVILQRFKDGALSDARVFKKSEGLTWLDSAGREFTLSWSELREWVGERAQAGRLAPKGIPTLEFVRAAILFEVLIANACPGRYRNATTSAMGGIIKTAVAVAAMFIVMSHA